MPLRDIWEGSQERYTSRARSSGRLRAQSLWGEALEQAKLGRLGIQLPNDVAGNVATFLRGDVNVAFRSGVGQSDKLGECDDIR